MAVLFAPILRTTQPAFAASQDALTVYYTLPQAASLTDITNIEVKVNTQDTNSNVINNITGILSLSISSGSFSISKKDALRDGHWIAGKLYKIQARFVNSSGQKSEWSNIMITKAITSPRISIINSEIAAKELNEISAVYSETETMPTFYGRCDFKAGESEWLDTYKFDLYKDDKLIESSGELQYNQSAEAAPRYRFLKALPLNQQFKVIFSIVSNNGYTAKADDYVFKVISNKEGMITNTILNVDDSSITCRENAIINIYLTSQQLIGNYILVRSDEDTNYEIWEDIKKLTYAAEAVDHELIYTDYYIDSGKHYKYALQQVNTATSQRSEMLLSEEEGPFSVNFEYSYLCGNGTQIKLNLNGQVSSFKHTRLQSKQDTLGSQYATILQNGYAYYAEFPISGLISAYMDEENIFMSKDFDELSISPTPETVKIERLFRHKVETFLNNGDYKLFKTPTEADKNIIVGLVGVSLSPQQSLNRMIYSFSATAYEVAENSLTNLKELGINTIGEWKDILIQSSTRSFGQLNGDFVANTELYNEIQKQEEQSFGGYKYQINSLRQLKLSNTKSVPTSFSINGQNINVAKNKQYVLTNLQDSDVASIKVLEPASLLVDYTLDKTLQAVAEPTSVAKYLLRDWGQISRTPVGETNIDIMSLIIADSVAHYSNNATLQNDGTYTYTSNEGQITLKYDGIETINFRNAEGAQLKINNNIVYVGNTSVYRLQPITDGLDSVILIKDMPVLIDYKLRVYKTIVQGGQ